MKTSLFLGLLGLVFSQSVSAQDIYLQNNESIFLQTISGPVRVSCGGIAETPQNPNAPLCHIQRCFNPTTHVCLVKNNSGNAFYADSSFDQVVSVAHRQKLLGSCRFEAQDCRLVRCHNPSSHYCLMTPKNTNNALFFDRDLIKVQDALISMKQLGACK